MTDAILLSLDGISRHYTSGDTVVRALDGVTIHINAGEFVAIMGASGSGKSTLMNIIGCLDKPTAGTYRVLGQEASKLDPDELAALRRKTFGFIFQRYNLLATATAEENVEIPAVYAGLPRAARISRAKELLARLGLGERGTHRPSELSGGQQQRVAIARALVNDPTVILADEPTGALDSRSGEEVMNLLKSLHAEGRTVILITHDEKVAAHAKRIIRVKDGKVTGDAPSTPSPPTSGGEGGGEGVVRQELNLQGQDSGHRPPLPPKWGAREEKGEGAATTTAVFEETMRTALRALHANLFRTALTLLGIVIGVAAVIAMMAVGNGSKQKVLDQISAMGTNLLNIRPGAAGIRSSGDIATMTLDDANAIADLPNVDAVVPERSGRATLRAGNTDYATTADGVGPDFPAARDWAVQSGHFFTDRDMQSYAPVAVLGQTVVSALYPPGTDPVGTYVIVGKIPFEVVGVMSAKGAAAWGGDQDDSIWIPVTTGLIRLFGKSYINSITVKVGDSSDIDATEAAITALLKSRHGAEDFRVRNTASLLETATETQNTLTVLLGAVAAISLLVGGIGVMNIMLVSVTERTREIGIRMATGARRRDIMLQFNTEAAVVCIIGGVMGLLVGWGAGFVISLFGVDVVFSAAPAALAFSCAVLTGLLFGYLPASKAAHLDPVVALSSE